MFQLPLRFRNFTSEKSCKYSRDNNFGPDYKKRKQFGVFSEKIPISSISRNLDPR